MEILIVYWQKLNKKYAKLKQKLFRTQVKRFAKLHDIKNENGELYNLNYHAFRHSPGTKMLNKGIEINKIYAKFKNLTIQKEYKKLDFIGVIVEEISEEGLNKTDLNKDKIKKATLPDGVYSKPIDNKGNVCAHFNMCIIGPNFITTPKHLPIHKDHLKSITG